MEIILNLFQSGFNLLVPFVILISLTVFIHELGHFLVAKYFGVRVEVFSIGIGKKLWKHRYGDTEYAISLFPIGGYVKMFGDELGSEMEDSEKPYSFAHKPVLQRIAVVLAGPFMNLLFAIFLFFMIATQGEEQKAPILGDILSTTPAYAVGLRSGDQITAVNNTPIQTWAEVQSFMTQAIGSPIAFKIRRQNSNNTPQEVEVQFTPVAMPDQGLLSLNKTLGSIEGLTNLAIGTGIGISKQDSWAYRAGFRTGDLITKINQHEVKYWREAEGLLLATQEPLLVTVHRLDETEKFQPVEISIQEAKKATTLTDLGFEHGELFLARVVAGSPAESAGLLAGDKLLEIQSHPILDWDIVQTTVKNFKIADGKLKIKVERAGEIKSFEIQPVMTSTTSAQGLREDRFTIGITPWLFPSYPEMTTVHYGFSLGALKRGFERTWEVTAMTLMSFVKLFKAEISPKNIGGIISIGEAAKETFKMGLGQFFGMMGVISINLFILNLLPVPVLDGGHMVFYTIELLKGSPLSLKKIELAQRFGVVVLVSLMVFALFNDFTRLLGH